MPKRLSTTKCPCADCRADLQIGYSSLSFCIAVIVCVFFSATISSSAEKKESKTKPKPKQTEVSTVLAFDAPTDKPAVPGFEPIKSNEQSAKSKPAKNSAKENRQRDRRYAEGLLKKYDSNGNKMLEREEWKRISGQPAKADSNGDGVITLEELVVRVAAKRQEEIAKKAAKDQPTKKAKSSSRRDKKKAEGEVRKSYRLTPAVERLPKGLPSWFASRDKNGDGQVAMHEYSRSWSKSKVAEFTRYDQNGDGILTPSECVKK